LTDSALSGTPFGRSSSIRSNRHRRASALVSYVRWQIGSRLVPGPVAVPFVGATRLLATAGMTGATGNVYCGLHEFEDMGFVLHVLRDGDLFVDVGANVGSYTLLAAGACRASVLAMEPSPSTFSRLEDNIRLNGLQTLVDARNVGVGSRPGTAAFSQGADAMNHVLSPEEAERTPAVAVSIDTLDRLLGERAATVVKIDVEGYETEVIRAPRKRCLGRPLSLSSSS